MKLYHDALAEARRAMELDRGNIDSYRVASWSLAKMGRRDDVGLYYQKQLALLGKPQYRDSPVEFHSVLDGLPPELGDDFAVDRRHSVLYEFDEISTGKEFSETTVASIREALCWRCGEWIASCSDPPFELIRLD